MRKYTEDDFTDMTKFIDDEEIGNVFICNGCGIQLNSLGDMQHDHYKNCSTKEIDKESKRQKEGYYNQVD